MILGAFTSFDKCPLIIVSFDKRMGSDYVDVVYEPRLRGFYFLNDDHDNFTFMEDGIPAHHSLQLSKWTQVHSMKKLQWHEEAAMACEFTRF